MMKKSSEGGDSRFPPDARQRCLIATGSGHSLTGNDRVGRVAVKVDGRGPKLWVFPRTVFSIDEETPSSSSTTSENERKKASNSQV